MAAVRKFLSKKQETGHGPLIYILEDVQAGAIKIGRSAHLKKRLVTLKTGHFAPLRLLAVAFKITSKTPSSALLVWLLSLHL